jgi:hypothetical protein
MNLPLSDEIVLGLMFWMAIMLTLIAESLHKIAKPHREDARLERIARDLDKHSDAVKSALDNAPKK